MPLLSIAYTRAAPARHASGPQARARTEVKHHVAGFNRRSDGLLVGDDPRPIAKRIAFHSTNIVHGGGHNR